MQRNLFRAARSGAAAAVGVVGFHLQLEPQRPFRTETRIRCFGWRHAYCENSDRRAARVHATGGILLVVACEEECGGLISRLGLVEVWRHPSGLGKQRVLQGTIGHMPVQLAVTGVLEHNAAGLVARLLCAEGTRPRICVNFGCVGAYERQRLGIGDAFFVRESRHYDVEVPEPDAWDIRTFRLFIPEEEPLSDIVCTTGSRFSRGQPGCDCEDMELYGLASLCEATDLPLCSLKYVANFCNEAAVKDCFDNMERVRTLAEDRVIAFLHKAVAADAIGCFVSTVGTCVSTSE